jgi:small subunit ribosomal protein S20
LVDAEDESAGDAVTQAMSALDRAASKGAIHSNNASRRKSRLMKFLHSSQAR